MNTKKLKLVNLLTAAVISLVAVFYSKPVNAQTQQFTFTQYINNATPYNPAFALTQGASVNTAGRKQWVGIDGAPTSYLLNGSLPISSINGSVGLIAMNDSYTVEHQTEVNLFFAKAIKLNSQLSLGVSINGGLRNYVANYSSLSTTDAEFKNDIRQTSPNLGFGVLLYSDKYYLGVSAPELTVRTLGVASQQDQTNFTNHYYFTGGFTHGLGDDVKIKYATLVSYAKGLPVLADLSSMIMMKKQFGVGVNVRSNKELAGMFNINVDIFRLGYSYQFGTTASNIGGFSNATQEVTLGLSFGKK